MNFEPGPDGVVRISFEIADLKTWVQIPVGALDLRREVDTGGGGQGNTSL